MSARRLIVTADDFGISPEVNAGVVQAYKDGLLRFASLMATGEAAAEAASLARANPGLGVGLHLDLCRDAPAAWGWRYFSDPRLRASVEGEIARQVERLIGWGIKPTHMDGHFNIHVHPVIFPAMVRVARRFGIERLRLPGGEVPLSLGYAPARAPALIGLGGVFAGLRAWLRPQARGLWVPERTFGLLRSGLMTEDYLLWLLERLPEGETEIYFHPSADPTSAVTDTPTPTHRSVTELRALTSPRALEAVRRRGIALVAA